MYEVVGVHGERLHLENLSDVEVKDSLTYQITELLTEFGGPIKKVLIMQFFTERYSMTVIECIKSMVRVGKAAEHDGYIALDARLFDPNSYSVQKDDTFGTLKNYNNFLQSLEWRQKAFAVFLAIREEFDAEHWYIGEDPAKPWLIMTFVSRGKCFFVLRIKDFNMLYAHDLTADSREIRDRLVLVETKEEQEEVLENNVQGVLAFVTVDDNFQVSIKRTVGKDV